MRVLITLDINDDDRDAADVTYDDIHDGLAARLGFFYPSDDGYEVRAEVVAVADVTESHDFVLAALSVGIEGADADEGWPVTDRVLEEAELALERLSGRA